MKNKRLVKNIRKVDTRMHIHRDSGVRITSYMCDVPGYKGEVWFDPEAISNIFSLSQMEKYHRVTHDSEQCDGDLIVHMSKKQILCKEENDLFVHKIQQG